MELINQHTKRIMEGCKERALDAGLSFDKETLEYIVTNTDMLELSPKNMIPTLYDHWLQEIQVLRGKGEYEYYPHNPYETVINTRPAISFYNDNNPDWLNVMIFYHVIAHIDFFQNNKFFEKTWDYDFKEKALTEKRIIAKLRSRKGRAVDYIIEFTKGIDNLVSYFESLSNEDEEARYRLPGKIDYYFNYFIQGENEKGVKNFLDEIERYNQLKTSEDITEKVDEKFLISVKQQHPEFEELYKKHINNSGNNSKSDLIKFLIKESKFLNEENNKWMSSIMDIVRDTALYFSPMIRTKVMNEGWASYWHEKLFLMDDRIKGHEVSFAKINAKVTSLSKVGLNPYAIGWRLFMYIEEQANKGKISYEYQKIKDLVNRNEFDENLNIGKDFIFDVRKNYCDQTFLNSFVDQEFVNKHKLKVIGERINQKKNVREYYIKSKKVKDYKKVLVDSLFHPPHMKFDVKENKTLYLEHNFEGKELYRDYIQNTLVGLEYLWGNTVRLETTEYNWDEISNKANASKGSPKSDEIEPILQKVIYTVENKKVTKQKIS